MFLRNYDNYFVAAHLMSSGIGSASYGNTSEFRDGYVNQKCTNTALESVQLATSNSTSGSRYMYPPINFSTSGICLGDGDVPVTYDDYKLSGEVISNKLVSISNNARYDESTKKYIRELICTYYNNTDAAITIKEWGLFRGNPGSSSLAFSNNSSDVVLIYREVLDAPITITAGETATIRFSLAIPTCSQ